MKGGEVIIGCTKKHGNGKNIKKSVLKVAANKNKVVIGRVTLQ